MGDRCGTPVRFKRAAKVRVAPDPRRGAANCTFVEARVAPLGNPVACLLGDPSVLSVEGQTARAVGSQRAGPLASRPQATRPRDREALLVRELGERSRPGPEARR